MASEQTRESYVADVEVREGQSGEPSWLGGYAAVFNQETIIDGPGGTRWRERISPKAFEDAMKRDDVIAAVNHDHKMVLGRNKRGTLQLSADAHGLRYDVKLPNTTLARDTVESVRRGDYPGSSFKFVVKPSDIHVVKEPGHRSNDLPLIVIDRVTLIDVGPVTFPAYEGTSVSARSASDVPQAIEEFYQERAKEHERSIIAEAAVDAAKTPDAKAIDAMLDRLEAAKAWKG